LQKVINLDGHAEKEEETINTNLNYSHGKEIDEGHYSKKDGDKKVNGEIDDRLEFFKNDPFGSVL
jgi:hypothetical protein